MLIEEKYFNQDKNYLLKTVQAFCKESLLDEWIAQISSSYNELHNPMGLVDDFIIQLKADIQKGKPLLETPYDILSAIYRFYFADNQLEFQWDGRSHMETYDEEWKEKYAIWIKELSSIKGIQRSVIKYATQGEGFNHDFLTSNIKRSILQYFKVRMRSNKLYRISA